MDAARKPTNHIRYSYLDGDKRLTAEYSDILRTYENTGPGVSVISYR